MAEDIDTVIRGLSDLQKVSKYTGLEFQGFAKNLVAMADASNQSGRRWTIFSRLVSGTPIWKVQNYIRGILGVLGEFNSSAIAAAEAQTKQSEATTEQIKGFRELEEQMGKATHMSIFSLRKEQELRDFKTKNQKLEKKLQKEFKKGNYAKAAAITKELDVNKNYIKSTVKMRKAHIDNNSAIVEAIKTSERYNFVLAAGGTNRQAETAAMIEMNKQYKVQAKMMEKVHDEAKIQYSFDKSRIDVAKKIAKESAKGAGKGRFGISRAIRKAAKNEKKAMKRDQKDAVFDTGERARKARAIFSKNNMATALMPVSVGLAPLKGLFKLTKASFPFTKESRKFRIKMNKFSQ